MPSIDSCLMSLTSKLSTPNTISQSVYITDDLKIGLEYDNHRGLLNILLKNTGHSIELPSQINILSYQSKEDEITVNDHEDFYCLLTPEQDLENEIIELSYGDKDDPKICIELSNIYVYDLFDEDENDPCQTTVASSPSLFSSSLSPSSSSCFDEPTIDNDDGYSTHSLDDIEQQQQQQPQPITKSPSKLIVPFVSYKLPFYLDEHVLSIRQLIEQLIWSSPFKKTMQQMMNNRLFD